MCIPIYFFFSVLIFMFKLCIYIAFIVMPTVTLSFWLTMMRFPSCSAFPTVPVMGFFWNLITGCTALISDGTFNQKDNQKVIHSWDSLQSQWSHNTTCWKGLLASSSYVAIKSNWLLSSQHPLPFSELQHNSDLCVSVWTLAAPRRFPSLMEALLLL